jgi:plastocyanin domain-containing protein
MLHAMGPAPVLRHARFVPLLAAGLLVGACNSNPPSSSNHGHVIQVTDAGFEPKVIEVNKGEPVTLVVTRRSDHTCATEMIFAGNDSTYDLPYEKTVRIQLAPMTGDTLRYACGMDMYRGMIVAK